MKFIKRNSPHELWWSQRKFSRASKACNPWEFLSKMMLTLNAQSVSKSFSTQRSAALVKHHIVPIAFPSGKSIIVDSVL